MDQCSDQPTTRISAPPASHFAVADTTTARRNSARMNAGRNAYRIAIVALIISVVAPFGEDALLRTLNIHTPMAYRVAETAQEVNRLEQRSADLETQLAAATAQLATYRSRTDAADARLERTLASTRTLALVQLGAVLRRPGPFDLELAVVRSNAAAAPELIPLLTKIAPYAATGVPGNAQLQRDFAVLRARVELERARLHADGLDDPADRLAAQCIGVAVGRPFPLGTDRQVCRRSRWRDGQG